MNEPPTQTPGAEQRGLRCPRCGCPDLRCIETRAFTGRTKIMKMEGAYHGTYDPIEDEKAGIPDAAAAVIVSIGTPP